jgi:hypothetical protein
MVISKGNSQTLFNDTLCAVPCNTLRNALIMKTDYKLKMVELAVARDSINILINKGKSQDTLIERLFTVIEVKDTIIDLKDSVIVQRELQIGDLKENNETLEKRNKKVEKQRNYAVGSSSILVIILLIIVF